uniref:NADH dehydrogenase subunit 1 n=1 Tax=Pallenopsis patagonica TaxID=648475 RepID=UPI00226CE6C5|nr:NADH dehydrogenase subunit 1 [Pallenopsis patagonica]UZA61350.1 NADH dehydrogenase subunit 1 [Pallenopsis patagonica]
MLYYLIMLVFVLVGVAFFTLFERKVLGYVNNRKGPNKVLFLGLGQAISDGVKLFGKEYFFPYLSMYFLFFLSPMIIFFMSLSLWMILPVYFHFLDFYFGLLFFLCLTGLSVYALIFSGWASNSKYSIFGAYRGVAQTISYEVSLALVMMSFVFLIESYNLEDFNSYQDMGWLIFMMMPLGAIWFVSLLAESNRTPFDFTEGESELVSGFNIEYGGYFFALIFLGEYSSILFVSGMYVVMFMGGIGVFYTLKVMFIVFMFILIRGTLPRFRYDNLMYLAWKIYLPMSLNFLIFYLGYKSFLSIYLF